MDLITCPKCEKQIREVAQFCPYCGFQLSQETVSKQKEEQHEFNNPVKNSSPREKETFDSWMRRPKPVAGIVTFLIIVIPLLLWDSFKSSDFSIFSKDINKSSPNIAVKPKSFNTDSLMLVYKEDHIRWSKYLSITNKDNIEQESKPNQESKPYSSSSNGYIVKNDAIWAATSQANFDLMMNCLINGDKEALKEMINNGQLIYLHRNDVVFVVKVKFLYSIVRQEGSTELLYVDNDFLQKQ